jgi:hypothetical protein
MPAIARRATAMSSQSRGSPDDAESEPGVATAVAVAAWGLSGAGLVVGAGLELGTESTVGPGEAGAA